MIEYAFPPAKPTQISIDRLPRTREAPHLQAVVSTDTAGAVLNGVLNLWDEHQQLRASFSSAGLAQRPAPPDGATTVAFDGNR